VFATTDRCPFAIGARPSVGVSVALRQRSARVPVSATVREGSPTECR